MVDNPAFSGQTAALFKYEVIHVTHVVLLTDPGGRLRRLDATARRRAPCSGLQQLASPRAQRPRVARH
jgi:hypothetical protein